MNVNEIGDNIIDHLKEWSKHKDKLVVAIDGIPGVGKTTITDYVSQNYAQVLPVHIDDFMANLDWRVKELEHHPNPTEFFLQQWFEYDDIRKFIKSYKLGKEQSFQAKKYRSGSRTLDFEYDFQKPILLFEGVLMFDPKLLDDLWDKRIFLDGDEEEITARRIAREKARWGDKYIPETDPKSWHHMMDKGHKKYQQQFQPNKKADLTFHVSTSP